MFFILRGGKNTRKLYGRVTGKGGKGMGLFGGGGVLAFLYCTGEEEKKLERQTEAVKSKEGKGWTWNRKTQRRR